MSILRDNRDSVMAMLEAFVYDPLISWRLMAEAGRGYYVFQNIFLVVSKL